MSTEKTLQIISSSSDATYAIGEQLGRACKGQEVFLLVSDLGGGKTTLTKGLAKGLGSQDNVSSPTFTVNKIYKCRDGLELHHFDFYRLSEGGMVAHELAEVVDEPNVITVVEWGNIVSGILPNDHIEIRLERMAEAEEKRKITITYPESLVYVTKELV